MADSTKARLGWVDGHQRWRRSAAENRSSPSLAITIGAALWAR